MKHAQSLLLACLMLSCGVAPAAEPVPGNTPPPPSSYPHLSDGTLVPLSKFAFPHLPGVNTPHEANAGQRLDFGPNWRRGIVSVQVIDLLPQLGIFLAQGLHQLHQLVDLVGK